MSNRTSLIPSSSRSTRSDNSDGSDGSSSSADSGKTITSFHQSRARVPYTVGSGQNANNGPGGPFLLPAGSRPSSASARRLLANSRSSSPFFSFNGSENSSSCSSESDSPEPSAILLRSRARRDNGNGWWSGSSSTSRARGARKSKGFLFRFLRKSYRRLVRHPFLPRQPITIVLTLVVLSVFAIFLTLLLIHIFNPDKEPLPWRAYCSFAGQSTKPPTDAETAYPYNLMISDDGPPPPFPQDNLETFPPAGLFVAVFSVDSAFERRMLIRDTWARHPRSRNGGGIGDNGNGTSRTIVRFVLGQPRSAWDAQIKLEQELYNDIVVLPIPENMNGGKTHSFVQWASRNAWVPPNIVQTHLVDTSYSYSNVTGPAQSLAPHDPIQLHDILASGKRLQPWTRPDFIVKVDDDSFVMLAELESRLRVQLYEPNDDQSGDKVKSKRALSPRNSQSQVSHPDSNEDPLIYWGYLVKNRFMAGELYALSWSLVTWAAEDFFVAGLTKGAEDKQTAKWMKIHPRASQIRWASERVWIYDHPRAGTVYSHGFLFPSEAVRVRENFLTKFESSLLTVPLPEWGSSSKYVIREIPRPWARSTVSKFGSRYQPPLLDLTTNQQMEALVEGSDLSMLHENSAMTPDYAYIHREGRTRRYRGKRVGGTICVHFIKKNLWYLETAEALLEGAEFTDLETTTTEAGKLWLREQERLIGDPDGQVQV